MAELLGLLGSIATIVQIAGAAIKLSNSLYQTAQEVGSAKDDIQAFAMDIEAFSSVILLAHQSIRGHCQKEHGSSVLQYIEDNGVLGQLVNQSKRVKNHIKKVRPRIRDVRSRISLISRFKWMRQRPEVKALHPEMECVKTNLMMLMHIIQLELKQEDEQSEETIQEM
jgi:hypothetical protein